MAKLFYGPDHGTITVRNDDDVDDLKNDIEVTPEQASAVCAWQAASMLSAIAEALSDISIAVGAVAHKD